jgi:hypothetical protein
MDRLRAGEPLEEFLASPLAPGGIRVLNCSVCGVITYIQVADVPGLAVGDPAAHNRWHDRRGLVARIRRALTWR